MSRCFEFPPPGYVRNGVTGEDLKRLIAKLKKEIRRAKKGNKKKHARKADDGNRDIKQSAEEYFPHSNRKKCLLQKHKNSEVLFIKAKFSTPTKMDYVLQEDSEKVNMSSYIEEQSSPTFGNTEIIDYGNVENDLSSGIFESDAPQIESKLRELIFDWMPSPMQTVRTDLDDDQDWLFDNIMPKDSTQVSYETYAFPFAIPF